MTAKKPSPEEDRILANAATFEAQKTLMIFELYLSYWTPIFEQNEKMGEVLGLMPAAFGDQRGAI